MICNEVTLSAAYWLGMDHSQRYNYQRMLGAIENPRYTSPIQEDEYSPSSLPTSDS